MTPLGSWLMVGLMMVCCWQVAKAIVYLMDERGNDD